ncbi:GFA family protein [Aquibium oceanicum]|uniref:Aldehyde-activating protein n=1 Tax=Aquibium oceanicum TaxID=1670800 RepID=A0A1L3SRZ9_9HYPH|nr:GFA family protein [Aquibium oceanicum]APH72188.1 aldehyde-activating protein [Aquibium oceanicum]
MLEGSCHCGRLRWSFGGQPDGATACNCTICRRYGTLWIYGYEGEEITTSGDSRAYSRGKDRGLSFHFCPDCGCVAWWRGNRLEKDGRRRMAVNVRLAEPDTVAAIPIDHFDGLVSFEDLPRDGRCVGDYWS